MSSSSSKNLPTISKEFSVGRSDFDEYFAEPLPKSTFFDLVKNRKILPLKGRRGQYRLNASLIRLGLPPVDSLPQKPLATSSRRTGREILELAFTFIDPHVFDVPSWVCDEDKLTKEDEIQARILANLFRSDVVALSSTEEKSGYAMGAFEAHNDLTSGKVGFL
jgi:hypothetical protein